MQIPKEIEKILRKVQKPARYIGGEYNSAVKDPSKVSIRMAFCRNVAFRPAALIRGF